MKPGEIKKNDATVNVDGSIIKQIREQQSLTQLYVAKVVGVTTDTISRWENNRYPTIKRTNAERLAEALEVDIEQLLRAEPDDADAQVEKGQQDGTKRRTVALVLVLTLIIGCVSVWGWLWLHPTKVLAERILPSYASPGAVIPVVITVKGEGVRGVVRETLPQGWTFVGASPPPSSVDNEKGLLRWIVQVQATPLNIYYLVRVPPSAVVNTMPHFNGAVVVHTATGTSKEDFLGVNQLVVAYVHWADLNADGVIDDDEMLEAASLSENMPGLPLDLDSVEELWIEEHYFWSVEHNKFLPVITPNGAEEMNEPL